MDEDSEFAKLNRRLRDWERDLPPEHAFGRILLGGYRHYEEDLVSLGTVGAISRRVGLPDLGLSQFDGLFTSLPYCSTQGVLERVSPHTKSTHGARN